MKTRETIAAMAMQGILSKEPLHAEGQEKDFAYRSVQFADALIAELAATNPKADNLCTRPDLTGCHAKNGIYCMNGFRCPPKGESFEAEEPKTEEPRIGDLIVIKEDGAWWFLNICNATEIDFIKDRGIKYFILERAEAHPFFRIEKQFFDVPEDIASLLNKEAGK